MRADEPDDRSCLGARPWWALVLPLAACSSTQPVEQAFSVELEGAAVWQTRNDVAIPGDTGTRFALDELIGSGPYPGGRFELTWRMAERHQLRALIAPLELSGSGTLDEPVSFADRSFAAGVETDAKFRFDSYRLTYRYRFWHDAAWEWHVGFTGNLRDAEIELEQPGVSGRKTDTGFVPLLNLLGSYRFTPDWRVALDVDAAAASQGRAIDAALKGYWRMSDGLELGFGYRTIEGGADNDEVYTFSWIHQAVLSLRFAR